MEGLPVAVGGDVEGAGAAPSTVVDDLVTVVFPAGRGGGAGVVVCLDLEWAGKMINSTAAQGL